MTVDQNAGWYGQPEAVLIKAIKEDASLIPAMQDRLNLLKNDNITARCSMSRDLKTKLERVLSSVAA